MKKILISILFAVVSIASFSQSLFNRWVPTSGTGTYTTNVTALTSYNNSVVYVKFGNTNPGAATININSIGAAPIRAWDGDSWEVLAGSELDVNTIYKLSYSNGGAYYQLEGTGSGGASQGLQDVITVDPVITSDVDIDINGNYFSFATGAIDPIFKVEPDGDVIFGTAGTDKFNGSTGQFEMYSLLLKELIPNISASALTGDVNNYSPSNGNMLCRFVANGNYQITGLQFGGSQLRIIQNYDDTNTLTLVDESGSSSVENRFFLGGSNLTLQPSEIIMLFNDGVNSHGWRPVVPIGSGGGGTGTVNSGTDGEIAYYDGTGTTLSGKLLENTDLVSALNVARTATTNTSTLQSDNLHTVYLNGTFNITVDALTDESVITYINIGSGTVTLVSGTATAPTPNTIAAGSTLVLQYETTTAPLALAGTGGTVTSVGFTGGLISVANATTTPALTVAGTSGGIPYFSSGSTWASSAALAANSLVIGGGAGVAPSTTTTGTGVLTFLGTPSWTNFNSAITGTAPFWNTTGTTTLTGTTTITSSAVNRLNYNGTFTAASDLDSHEIHSPTITGDGTVSHIVEPFEISPSVTAGANTQELNALVIKPTHATGGFSTVSSIALKVLGTSIGGNPTAAYFRSGTTTSASFGMRIEDSAVGTIFSARGDGVMVNSATTFGYFDISYASATLASNQYVISHNRTPDAGGTATALRATATITSTSGDRTLFGHRGGTFSPSSGTGTMSHSNFIWTINQTSTASGAVKVLDIIPTYTSVLGNVTGINYNPTVTSVTGTHYGILSVPTASLSGFATATPNSTLTTAGSFAGGYVAKTANYTATVNDYTIECTANTFQVTLPTAAGITGRIYHIVNSGAGTITLATTSSQTFVNVTATPTTLIMATIGTTSVQSNGANWIKLSGL